MSSKLEATVSVGIPLHRRSGSDETSSDESSASSQESIWSRVVRSTRLHHNHRQSMTPQMTLHWTNFIGNYLLTQLFLFIASSLTSHRVCHLHMESKSRHTCILYTFHHHHRSMNSCVNIGHLFSNIIIINRVSQNDADYYCCFRGKNSFLVNNNTHTSLSSCKTTTTKSNLYSIFLLGIHEKRRWRHRERKERRMT